MPATAPVRIAPFVPEHLDEVMELCELHRWLTLTEDPARALRAFTAPGVVTLVALRNGGELVGFAQALTDGSVQAFLSRLMVAEGSRRSGVGRLLLQEVLARSGALRVDLLAADGSDEFYRSFPHRQSRGYRIASEEGSAGLASWPPPQESDRSAPA
jgi:GNAT superfamily N-acetyltransferase